MPQHTSRQDKKNGRRGFCDRILIAEIGQEHRLRNARRNESRNQYSGAQREKGDICGMSMHQGDHPFVESWAALKASLKTCGVTVQFPTSTKGENQRPNLRTLEQNDSVTVALHAGSL
jgi:hypothetical protein